MSRLSEILLSRDPPANHANPAKQGDATPQGLANVATLAGGPSETEFSQAAPPAGMARCACCKHFEARPGDTPNGWCTRHQVETWSTPLFECLTYRPADPALVALARRRHAVAADLKAHPEARHSFDVANATPSGQASGPVSVVLGLRDSTGAIVTGELTVPAERWPGLTPFCEYWRESAEARLQ